MTVVKNASESNSSNFDTASSYSDLFESPADGTRRACMPATASVQR
jgi:hypothetical protein